ncbi:hypothetical protein [Sphingomonas sp. UYP23]
MTRMGHWKTHPVKNRMAAGLDPQGIRETGAHPGRKAQDRCMGRDDAAENAA